VLKPEPQPEPRRAASSAQRGAPDAEDETRSSSSDDGE
jgi:hypothetical protein